MKAASSTTVGSSSTNASQRSSSSRRSLGPGACGMYTLVSTRLSAIAIPLHLAAPGPWRSPLADAHDLRVNLLQFVFRPLHRILSTAALDGFGVHVGDDVFGQHFGRLLA